MLTRPRMWLGAVMLGLIAVAVPPGWAWANHIRIEMSGDTVAVTPAMQETLRAENIRAQHVRARTIYVNKIEADEIQGVIHQTKDVKIGDAGGKIRAPEVNAGVIFAEEIHANSVVADEIYAREIHRK
jgi:hypothetical protein